MADEAEDDEPTPAAEPEDVPTEPAPMLDPTPAGPELDRLELPRRPGGNYDRLGRKQFVPVTVGLILESVPGAAARVRQVPKSHVVEDTEEEAMLACPCSAQPVAPYGELVECSGECGRWYYALGQGRPVHVVYGGMSPP